jgi:hypothetical protein
MLSPKTLCAKKGARMPFGVSIIFEELQLRQYGGATWIRDNRECSLCPTLKISGGQEAGPMTGHYCSRPLDPDIGQVKFLLDYPARSAAAHQAE